MSLNKKTALILLLAILLIGGGLFFAFFSSKNETYTAPTLTSALLNPALSKDSDNDGLKDWEEQLWKTDPNNPDTDGDGTPDGLEIKSGRNPLVPGPNDALDNSTLEKKVNATTESDLTETQKFSRELFLKVVAQKKAGVTPNPDDYQQFLDEAVKKESASDKPREFVSEDLKSAAADSRAALKSYGNGLAEILTKKPLKPLEHELVIVERAEKTGNFGELQKIKDNAAEYQRIENDLLQIPVPKSALVVHLLLINNVSRMIWSLKAFVLIQSDPLKALPGISAYIDNEDNFVLSVKGFKQFFADKAVEFIPEDRGYKLFNAI